MVFYKANNLEHFLCLIYFRLDENLMVKVSDFGLSKYLKEGEHYKLENKKKELPLRWMSIEAIENGLFSAKSDIASFSFHIQFKFLS